VARGVGDRVEGIAPLGGGPGVLEREHDPSDPRLVSASSFGADATSSATRTVAVTMPSAAAGSAARFGDPEHTWTRCNPRSGVATTADLTERW